MTGCGGLMVAALAAPVLASSAAAAVAGMAAIAAMVRIRMDTPSVGMRSCCRYRPGPDPHEPLLPAGSSRGTTHAAVLMRHPLRNNRVESFAIDDSFNCICPNMDILS